MKLQTDGIVDKLRESGEKILSLTTELQEIKRDQDRFNQILMEIETHNYYLNDYGMCNPQKIKNRIKHKKILEKELEDLKRKYPDIKL